MSGGFTVILRETTDDTELLYCGFLEETRQIFRSGALEKLEDVKSVGFEFADKAVCGRNGNQVMPKIEGREVQNDTPEGKTSKEQQETIVIAVFTVAGAFFGLAAIIVGRRMMTSRRHGGGGDNNGRNSTGAASTAAAASKKPMGHSAMAAAAVTEQREMS